MESLGEVLRFKADPSKQPLNVSRQSLSRLIRRFMSAQINAHELSEIAEALDAAEEVIYESGHEDVIGQALFELSSPEINGQITSSKCSELIITLSR